MRIQIVDPPAFTPPYDRALCAALARTGASVELVTSRFAYGEVPREQGYRVEESFYRRSTRRASPGRMRTALRLAEHIPDMLAYRRHADADVVHIQWLAVPQLDVHLLPDAGARVLTAHDVLPREPRPGQTAATRRLIARMDAVIVHSDAGADRLVAEAGADPARVHVIAHGAFDYLTRLETERPLDPELAAVDGPVILCFGLMRHYKGIDVLLDAFRSVPGAELWLVGMPRIPLEPLERLAAQAPGRVRFVPRFIPDAEIPAYFRRADLVVLPYREIDQSGVLATALAFGKPLVLSRLGGFSELGERHRAALLVPPGEVEPLSDALNALVRDRAARERLGAAAAAAAAGAYSWDAIAGRTLELYRSLLPGSAAQG